MTDTANAPERIWAYPDYSDWSETGGWVDHKDGKPESAPLTEYVLATHCDELVAAARAEGAREAQEKIARMEASLEILRDNPAAVHLNMLKGNIAKPTWEQIKHLYRAEFNLLQEDDDE